MNGNICYPSYPFGFLSRNCFRPLRKEDSILSVLSPSCKLVFDQKTTISKYFISSAQCIEITTLNSDVLATFPSWKVFDKSDITIY